MTVSDCGVESVKTNGYINAKTNIKKLQFGGEKCHKLHIGHKKHLCPDLYVDNWELRKKDRNKEGISNMEDIFVGDFLMSEKDTAKYLGDYLSTNGSNRKTIEDRKAKGQGAINKILSILDETCFGPFYFECAVILRNSLLLSTMLTNSEAWYGLSKIEIETLEKIDLQLLRRIFEVPFSCPKEMLYLETGCLPISSLILIRRLLFLHSILHEDSNSLIYRFFLAQLSNPDKGDWALEVKKNIEELQITETLEEIEKMSINRFRSIVIKAVRKTTFKNLIEIKNSHSKVKHIEYSNFEMQNYLKSNSFTNYEAKFTFHAKCRMLKIKQNFSQSYKSHFCPVCKNENLKDDQPHLLQCDKLVSDSIIIANLPEYEDLFCNEVKKQVVIVKLLKENFEKRRNFLEEEKLN